VTDWADDDCPWCEGIGTLVGKDDKGRPKCTRCGWVLVRRLKRFKAEVKR
jgi:hypothetical protein